MLEVNRFFGYVRIPYQHILRKPEIGPEYGECKHEFTNIVQVLLGG